MLSFESHQSSDDVGGSVCGESPNILAEPVAYPLYIFGAGHISFHLANAACDLDFETTVVDDREAYATRERFPRAHQVIAVDFEDAFARIIPDQRSCIVIVTRGHADDMRVLRWAVQSQARYIGMVGSRRKIILLFRELTREGLAAALFDRVYAPGGLDIGAITPEEIAISIAAELIAVRRHVDHALPHMSWFKNPKQGFEMGSATLQGANDPDRQRE